MKPLLNRGELAPVDIEFDIGPRRSAQQIARRSIILCCVAASGQFEPGHFNEWLKREHLWDDVSPQERTLFEATEPTEKQRINATWRSEALQVMLWSIQKLAILPPVTELVKVDLILDAMPDIDGETASFFSSSELRPKEEIDSELDKIVHCHWQIRNEQAYPEEGADPMIPGVVIERHWALAWIVNIDDEPWDMTPLST